MPAPPPLSLNEVPLNQAALKWLKQAKGEAPEYSPHLLNLLAWGLEHQVEGEVPDKDRYKVEQQIHLMFAWKPARVMHWLLSNPNEDGATTNLLMSLQAAKNPREAAAMLLGQVYSRMQSQLPALQPAASELS